jgi:lysophospholipase L1-like esterase
VSLGFPLAARELVSETASKGFKHSLVPLVSSLVVALLLAEVATRLALGFPLVPLVPPAVAPAPTIPTIPSDTRVYQLPAGQPPLTNSAGFHDHEYPVAKPPGTFRIVVLGDSVAFGYRVDLDSSMTKLLERKLNDTGDTRFEVLDFGVPGYNTTQELAYLNETALNYAPDLVLLIYVLNDADPVIVPEHGLGRGPDTPEPPELLTQSVGRFYFPQLLYGAYGRLRTPASLADDPRTKFTDDNPGWLDSQDALHQMGEVTRAHGIPLVVAIFPSLVQLDEHYPFAAIHSLIAGVASDAGAYPLDLFPAYRGQPARPLWVGPGDSHPNAQGHAIAANALYDYLRNSGLVLKEKT